MALKSTSKKTKKPAVATQPVAPVKALAKHQPAAKTAAPATKARTVKSAPADNTRNITLTYFAPEAGSVLLAGDFTKWENSPVRLAKEKAGVWKTTLSLKPGKYQYRLLVDGQWQNDPQCPELQPNEFGTANCVLSVAA